ncbi:MAG: hypothetical protein ACTSVW_01035 [Candidatus Njordarchaeales archaeon]
MKGRILRYWTYFRRGHSTYLVFFLSFANFMVIQYRLLIEYVPFLEALFYSLTTFVATFCLVYIPLATIIGWLDYKKFAVPMDSTVMAKASPWNRDLVRALILICDGKNEEAKKILQKWA